MKILFLIPFAVIENKILFGKITSYNIIQDLESNVIVLFHNDNGTSYYVKARFNQQSKNISP